MLPLSISIVTYLHRSLLDLLRCFAHDSLIMSMSDSNCVLYNETWSKVERLGLLNHGVLLFQTRWMQ